MLASRQAGWQHAERARADLDILLHAGMCGDVNLYLNDPDDRHCAEIEVGMMLNAPAEAENAVHQATLCQCRS